MELPTLYLDRFEAAEDKGLGSLHDLTVYLDGRFLSGADASVSVWDHGLLYGDAAVEGIRMYDRGIFKLPEHLRRLYDTCRILQLDVPIGPAEMEEVIKTVVRANQLIDAHIRPIVTRGVGQPGIDPRRCPRASVIVMAYSFEPLLGTNPIRVMVSSIRRKAPQSVDSRVKSVNYLDSVLAKLQANAAGYDDALVLDSNSTVSEATGMNVFLVRDSVLKTPSTWASLAGITRDTIMDLARAGGHDVVEGALTVGDLWTADEVFLCGTGAEIVPVKEIDGRVIGSGEMGELTKVVIDAYKRHVHSHHRTNAYDS